MLLCMILVLTYTVVIFAVTINKDQEYKNKLLVTKSEQLADSVREELDKKINCRTAVAGKRNFGLYKRQRGRRLQYAACERPAIRHRQ